MSNLILVSIGFGLGLAVSGIGLLILLKWDKKTSNEYYLKIKEENSRKFLRGKK